VIQTCKKVKYQISVVKPERKKLLSRPRHRWGDNIQIYLKETMSDDPFVDVGTLVYDAMDHETTYICGGYATE
jgi:hypothetical protein